MKPFPPRRLPGLPHLPLLASRLCLAGMPLIALGCTHSTGSVMLHEPPATVRAVSESTEKAAAQAGEALPISLDIVLRLTCEQNTQIALAREKLNEACAQMGVADLAWLPDVNVGLEYWRHEGGIQNEDGTLTHSSFGGIFSGARIDVQFDPKEVAYKRVEARSQVWQRKTELSKTTSETLLDATSTYIDLLLARTSEAIAAQLQAREGELLKLARDLAEKEPRSRIQAEAIEAEIKGHRQAMAKVRQQGDAAALKLAQLLGIDPNVKLMPIDERLTPLALADMTAPVDELVRRALAEGPGIRELEGLLGVVQASIDRAKGPGMFMPIFELHAAEGGFGAGPGDDMRWDNRFDIGLRARWNLTDLFKGREQQRVADSKLQQVYLTHQDLRQKLTVGVHEARSAIAGGDEQIRFLAEQVRHANDAYRESDKWMRDYPRAEDKVPEFQVLQALRSLELAHLRYLEAVSGYDKAQLRLLVLTGATSCETPPPAAQPSSLPRPAEPASIPAGTKSK